MKAGRELDALIEQHVFGGEVIWSDVHGYNEAFTKRPEGGHTVKPFSTSIAAAWEVVEKLREHLEYVGWTLTTNIAPAQNMYRVTFWIGEERGAAVEITAPHAICLAALAAVGALPPEHFA